MKKLIYTLSLLVAFSLAAQPLEYEPNTSNLFENDMMLATEEANVFEENASFDFNTKDYLPVGFDAYKGMIIDQSSLLAEEVIAFDFNTEDYLPKDFDAYKGMIELAVVAEEDAAFDFDRTAYLPIGFNPTITFDDLVTIEEEDAAFDFNTANYLPKTFDAYAEIHAHQEMNLEICLIYPSI